MNKRIELGVRVRTTDEKVVGTVDKIVVDPQEHEPGYLVVKRGRIRPRRIVVPVNLVTDVSSEEITLATTAEALKEFPEYEVTVREGRYHAPTPAGRRTDVVYTPPSNRGYVARKQRSVPESSIAVEKDMTVVDTDGLKVGAVDGLLLDRDRRQATHLVVRHVEPQMVRRRVVPVDLVADVRAGEVHLRIGAQYVYGLAVYRPTPDQSDQTSAEVTAEE